MFAPSVISPDGRRLAFTAKDASGKILIWVRPLDTLVPQALQGTDDAAFPFWSPDSRSIAFFAQGKLKRIDVVGGPPQTLCDAANGRGGTWNRDGVILFAPNTNGPLYRVKSAGGEPVAVTKLTQQNGHRFPSFLPDGRHFLYFAPGANGWRIPESLWEPSIPTSRSVCLAADTNALYSAPGDLLFMRQGTLLRQSFDTKKLELSGDPTPVAEQVAEVVVNTSVRSLSRRMAYWLIVTGQAPPGMSSWLWFDRAGKPVETLGTPGPIGVWMSRPMESA